MVNIQGFPVQAEVGIYKRKQESKKTRTRPRKRSRKKKKTRIPPRKRSRKQERKQ